MTARLIARHTSYRQLADYFAGYAITGERLATLTVPAAILMAVDDPIIPSADLQRLADNPHLTIHRTRHGGHTGFIDHLSRPSWANRFVLAQMAAHPTPGTLP